MNPCLGDNMSIVTCVYHDVDFDGKCSAAIIKRSIANCQLIGMDYGREFPWDKIPAGTVVYMVDFSLPIKDMVTLATSNKLYWIDHHITAIQEANRWDLDQLLEYRNTCVDKAACELVWEHVNGSSFCPKGVSLLGRYDVWDHSFDEDVLPYQMGLRTHSNTGPDSYIWNKIFTNDLNFYEKTVNAGNYILKYEIEKNKIIAQGCKIEGTLSDKYNTVALNISLASSKVFDAVWDSSKYELMMAFVFYDNQYRVSLYSDSDSLNVGEIAKSFGGGGHKNAAGFVIDDIFKVFTPYPSALN